jgi:hypothetical protein
MNGSSRVVLEGQITDPPTDDIKMKEVACLGGILAEATELTSIECPMGRRSRSFASLHLPTALLTTMTSDQPLS